VRKAAELFQLFKIMREGPQARVAFTLETHRTTKQRVKEQTGLELRGIKALDIGPGQQLRHMRCLSSENEVIGIDTDVIPQAFSWTAYREMLRVNSWMRLVKTAGRQLLGYDSRFQKQLASELGVSSFGPMTLLRMDATKMTFPDETFDFVCSYSAFEHIDNPKAALQEVARVLKKGGVAYISLHLYTSHSGCHDPGIMAKGDPEAPYWPHLRPALKHTIHPSTYLNEIRLDAWRDMYQAVMPGVHFVYERQDYLADPLKEIQGNGELREYSADELLTLNLVAIWKKS
jgi:ubiquinone/menaquinone biosynthesis C-methylase UbiE